MEMLKKKVNGINLAYIRRGRGKAMVLIHGHPLDHSSWDSLIPLLERNFELIIPDLRGFGESDVVNSPYQLSDMAADIALLLESLEIEKAYIIGHSMGGYISLAYARAFPDRLLGLGLISSHIFADPPERKPVRYETAAAVEMNGLGSIADSFPAKLTADSDLQSVLRETILRQSVPGVANSLRAMADRPDSTMLVKKLKVPMMVLHGAADILISSDRALEAKTLSRSIHLILLDKIGHMPMLETPSDTADAIKFFCDL